MFAGRSRAVRTVPVMQPTLRARRTPSRLVLASSLALAVVLAGCGASGSDAAPKAKATTTTAGGGEVKGGVGAGGGGTDRPTTTVEQTTTTVRPEDVDTEVGGKGDTDLPPAIDTDGTGGGGTDGGGGGTATGAGEGGAGGGGGTGTGQYPSKVVNGIPLDMSQPFDVGREWAVAANYGDFATVDLLSCANDARAVAQGQQHQASLAALRQLVAVRWRARDATSGWLEYSYQQVQAQIRTTIETPMILEDDGWKVCVYPQY